MKLGNVDRLAEAQVAGMSLRETAAVCGLSVSSVQRRLREESVQELIAQRRGERRDDEARVWSDLRTTAMSTLQESMFSDDERIRLRAAETVLSRAERFDFAHEFARRQTAISEVLVAWLADQADDEQ